MAVRLRSISWVVWTQAHAGVGLMGPMGSAPGFRVSSRAYQNAGGVWVPQAAGWGFSGY